MGKSVYSVVLMDEVVAAVDRMAYEENTSRSNMINRLLAQAAGLATPEQRKADIFGAVEEFIGRQNVLQRLDGGDAMLMLRSALAYKYNPSLRYILELAPHGAPYLAELRVTLRTQNPSLLYALDNFYSAWDGWERRLLPDADITAAAENGRYARRLRLPPHPLTEAQTGDALARYVAMFDGCLKNYFSFLPDAHAAQAAAGQLYARLTDAQTDFL